MRPKAAQAPTSLERPLPEATELSRQLLKVQEEERRRISRELHDETGQALMVLRFQLEMLLGEIQTKEAGAKIKEALEVLDRTIEGLRRTIARLHCTAPYRRRCTTLPSIPRQRSSWFGSKSRLKE